MKGWILYNKNSQTFSLSDDHGVSRLLQAAEAKNIDLAVYHPNRFDLVVTRADRKSILIDGQATALPNFVIPRTGANTSYFALAVLRQLEHLGVLCCNNARAVETVKDKLHLHQILAQSDLPTPKTMLVKFPIQDESVIKREIGFPLVIKNITGTEGAGIYLCEREDKFLDLIELIYSNNPKANIIIQEFISQSYGKDLRVFLVGGRVVGCMQRQATVGFKANYSRGGTVVPHKITPEIEWLATETARLVGLDVAGIDLLFDGDSYKICEANSSPGFKGLEQCVGPIIAESILDYLKLRAGG